MKALIALGVAAVVAGCAVTDADPRSQLERNLDVPVELAGQIHPARLAYLKWVLESDDVFTTQEQKQIRKQVLSGSRGLTLTL